MGWKAHRVVFQLLSPMHIGHYKLGNMQRTRPYVMGKVLWGALTARITRDFGFTDYEGVGARISSELAFTYFFPALKLRINPANKLPGNWCIVNDYHVCLPPIDDLASYLFLDTYASTALDYNRFGAEEGSLHEVEMVRPRTRPVKNTPLAGQALKARGGSDSEANELGAQIYLVGYILVRDGGMLDWATALERLQLGGKRGYGWGRVVVEKKAEEKGKLFGLYDLVSDTKRPQLTMPKYSPIAAHALAAPFKENGRVCQPLSGIEGPIEPLVGRETCQAEGFGRSISRARICWVPGSRTIKEGSLTIRIGLYGVWENTG